MGKIIKSKAMVSVASIDFLVNLGYAFVSPLIYIVCIDILNKNDAQLGIANSLATIGFLLFGYAAGSFSDRFSKKNMLVFSAIIAAGPLYIFIRCLDAGVDVTFIGAMVLLVIGFAMTLYQITLIAYMPDFVAGKDLPLANSVIKVTTAAASFAGPLILAYILKVQNVAWCIWAMILICLVSFVVALRAPLPQKKNNEPTRKEKKKLSFLSSLKYLFDNSVLKMIIGATALINFSFSMLNTVLILYMTRVLSIDQNLAITIWSFSSIGSFVGPLIAPYLVKRGMKKTIIIGVVLPTLPFVLLWFARPGFTAVCFIYVLINISRNIGAVVRTTIQQTTIETSVRGSVVGTMTTLTWGINPVGEVIGGVISNIAGPALVIAASVIMLLVSDVFMYVLVERVENGLTDQ